VRPANFREALSMVVDGELAPNVVDLIVVQQVIDPETGPREFADAPEVAEMMELAQLALAEDGEAQAVLFALRQSVQSDEAHDLREGIRQSLIVLEHLDAERFPVTAAGAHLKIGAAIAVDSRTRDEGYVEMLTTAVVHLERTLALLPAASVGLRGMAHYNAALAFHTIWQSADDWDGDENAADEVVRHGLAAIDAMDRVPDAGVGNRDSISRAVLSVLLADGEPRNAQAAEQVVGVLGGWLASPEMPPEDRSELQGVYDQIVSLRDRA
jgi:hypothetical protein